MLKTNKNNPPIIILHTPQLGENIGMVARAMLNCNVTELRLISPRDGWPSPSATSASAGAHTVIENTRVFNNTQSALADLEFVFGTTSRERYMTQDTFTPHSAIQHIKNNQNSLSSWGILFGCEKSGLSNDDLAQCNGMLTIPLSATFKSLNLAQAVLLCVYQWFSNNHITLKDDSSFEYASHQDYQVLFERLDSILLEKNFYKNAEKRPLMKRNLENIFRRKALSKTEIKILHGLITSLIQK